eukprot:158648_1
MECTENALRNLSVMYGYLETKINEAKNMTDLIPFMNSLMNMSNLKQSLTSILRQKFTQNEDNTIRSLFISVTGLNGIPSDNVQAQIFSYLKSSDYKTLSLISKHFRNIMNNYPFIYNEKNYQINFTFAENDNKCKETLGTLEHVQHEISISPCYNMQHRYTQLLKKNGFLKPVPKSTSFPWTSIKSWNIFFGNTKDRTAELPSHYQDDEKLGQMVQYNHNIRLIKTMSNNDKTAHKLTLDCQYNNNYLLLATFCNCMFPNCFAFQIKRNLNLYNIFMFERIFCHLE